MAGKNFYFENYQQSQEQQLYEDLFIESIRIYGIEVYYLPRTIVAKDEMLNEDDLSTFDDAYLIEMYVKSVDGFEGEGDLLSRFGLQIRDSMTMTVAMRVFDYAVAANVARERPYEGDLLYMPMNQKIFKIMHVEHEVPFYELGSLKGYDLRVELFEYSGERFNTGILQVDNRYTDYDLTSNTAYANVESVDLFADNRTIETEGDLILDFSENNPYGEEDY